MYIIIADVEGYAYWVQSKMVLHVIKFRATVSGTFWSYNLVLLIGQTL